MQTFNRKGINLPGKAPQPLGSYSHAIEAGPFLFLSGQGARDVETGKEVGITLDEAGRVDTYDIQAQTHAVIKNIKIILEAAGLTLQHLIDVSVYLADIKDFDKFNKIYGQYFSFDDPPARTTIQAAALPGNNYIEIKAIAMRS